MFGEGTMNGQSLSNLIRNKVDIVDVIGERIPLVKKGKNFFCICPFHDDTNPSMSVSREKQIYTCFTCHATGNVFTFLQEYESLSFVEALRELAGRAGIELPEDTYNEEAKRAADEKNKLYEVNKVAAQYFHYMLYFLNLSKV